MRRAVDELAAHGLHAIVAPELEFYLVDPDTYETYTPHLSSVYTVGSVSDPKGVFREIHRNARDLGLHPLGGAQEYGCGQFEINLAHGEAFEVDRPQPAVQDDGQADGGAARAAGDVHGQAARRRGLRACTCTSR